MLKYRPEIDGLRAVAIVAVLFYHAELFVSKHHYFRGGFLGVDVFFVISGYLITNAILKDLNNNTFSFIDFYKRRIRRLWPAFFFVLSISLVVGYNFMVPSLYKQFSATALSSLFFSSNIWFLTEDSYTAVQSQFKPLLHTWSLSVEEQFYFVFPLALFFIWKYKRQYLDKFLMITFILSLALAHYMSKDYVSANFFILPTRFWEMLAGALIVRLENRNFGIIKKFQVLFPTLGLLAIFFSFYYFDHSTKHPSLYTLAPVLGTMLIILFSQPNEIVTKILSLRIFTFIGLISYSLYLWHFPVFAFNRIINGDYFSLKVKLVLLILIFICACITYYLVEKQTRNLKKIKNKIFYPSVWVSYCLLVFIFLIIYFKEGIYSRIDNKLLSNLEFFYDTTKEPLTFGEKKIFLLGDSIAGHFHPLLFKYAENNSFQYERFEAPGCIVTVKGVVLNEYKSNGPRCNNLMKGWIEKIKKAPPSIIILMGRYPAYLTKGEGFTGPDHNTVFKGYLLDASKDHLTAVEATLETIKFFRSLNHKVILAATYPEYTHDAFQQVLPLVLKTDSSFYFGDKKQIQKEITNYLDTLIDYDIYKNRNQVVLKVADTFKNDMGFYNIDVFKEICKTTEKKCSAIYKGKLTTFDSSHPSLPLLSFTMAEIIRTIKSRNW